MSSSSWHILVSLVSVVDNTGSKPIVIEQSIPRKGRLRHQLHEIHLHFIMHTDGKHQHHYETETIEGRESRKSDAEVLYQNKPRKRDVLRQRLVRKRLLSFAIGSRHAALLRAELEKSATIGRHEVHRAQVHFHHHVEAGEQQRGEGSAQREDDKARRQLHPHWQQETDGRNRSASDAARVEEQRLRKAAHQAEAEDAAAHEKHRAAREVRKMEAKLVEHVVRRRAKRAVQAATAGGGVKENKVGIAKDMKHELNRASDGTNEDARIVAQEAMHSTDTVGAHAEDAMGAVGESRSPAAEFAGC